MGHRENIHAKLYSILTISFQGDIIMFSIQVYKENQPSPLVAMLHASETWPLTKMNLQHLQCNYRAMIRQTCSIKCEDVAMVRSSELLAKLELEDLILILRERRLRWFGHVERSSGAVRTACDIQIDGRRGAGRPKLTWKKLTEKDCSEWKLTTVDPQERSTWRSAMRAASQLSGRGPTDVAHWCGWYPCTCMLIKIPIMMIWWIIF